MAQSITDPTIKDPDPTLNQPLLGASSPGGADDVGSQIDALYKSSGITDAGSGGGFADRAYWLAHPSEVTNGRLGRDLAGTGTDQPTGTPGRGPWLNSGREAPEASIGEPTRKANGGFWTNPLIAPPPPVAPPTVPGGTTSPASPTGLNPSAAADPLAAAQLAGSNLSVEQRKQLIAYLLAQPQVNPAPAPVDKNGRLIEPGGPVGGGSGEQQTDPEGPKP